jgi:hypothetical protein
LSATPDPRSGLDAAGEWTPAFAGQRPPLKPGHQLSSRHGAYAVVQLRGRAAELAADLREVVPLASLSDSPTIDVLGLLLAQIERAHLVLAQAQHRELERLASEGKATAEERDDLRRLTADLRGWVSTALRYFEALGLSPKSRLALGLDVLRAEDGLRSLAEEGRRIRVGREATG